MGKGKKKQKNESKKKKHESTPPPPLPPEGAKKKSNDLLERFRPQRSKTMVDFRLPDESASFERRPSSFRKKINSFIQNSPLLHRPPKRCESLKQDISKLSNSLDSLRIEENHVLNDVAPRLGLKDLAKRKEKCQSLDFRSSLRSLDEEVADSQENLWPKRILRSSSLNHPIRWFSTTRVNNSKNNSVEEQNSDVLSAQHNVRSRSLNHIDRLGVSASDLLTGMNQDRPSELLVPNLKRPILTRSQANSSECFSVGFEGLSEEIPDEFVPASNDVVLKDALLEVCKRKAVDLSLSNVFLDVNKSPLPCLDIDTGWMGGKHIRIKVNDRIVRWDGRTQQANSVPLRKISSIHKSSKGSLRVQNISSEEPSLSETQSVKSAKRWSGFFGTSRDNVSRMETLVELLDSYNRNGIPPVVVNGNAEDFQLESDWKMIVKNFHTLDERQIQQQEAIWELISSELDYIKMLRVVCNLFLSCLLNLQSNQLLLDIDTKRLFSNIEDIGRCNENFWRKTIHPMLSECRTTGSCFDPELLRPGFSDFKSSFGCYERYCAEQAACQSYCREKLTHEQDHELFTAYLAWCEAQKECNRLKLMDILVKPMQRLTKYSLLLKAILKHTTLPYQKDALGIMIHEVDKFVHQVNTSLKTKHDLEQLRYLQSRIESYDVVETKDDDLANLVHKYSGLSLTDDIPGTLHKKRALLMESDLKFKDNATSSKIEVKCFLLTDMLLVTRPIKRLGEDRIKFRIIRQPFAVERLVVQEIPAREPPSLACVYLSSFKTAVTAFLLGSPEPDLMKQWSDALKRAKSQMIALLTPQPSRQHSEEAESYLDGFNARWACPPSPRGSSRVSSLAQSHSGSIEITENASSLSSVSRGVSVENTSEQRGSSLSSEEGNPSPRAPFKSPNTLTVHIPHLGQSLPNLSFSSISPNSHRPPNSLYLAPPKALSPTHRGISYPPPSPPRGSLRRGLAISVRNPPLTKCGRVEMARSMSINQTKNTSKSLTTQLEVPDNASSKSEESLTGLKFGDILRLVHKDEDSTPLEQFERKVVQWRLFGFTGGGNSKLSPLPTIVNFKNRRTRSWPEFRGKVGVKGATRRSST